MSTPRRDGVGDSGTRRRIVEAAIQIFADRGYHRASMEEIAAAAAVAKGTLYYNFSSKEMLFRAVIEQGMTSLRRAVQEAAQREEDAAALLERIVARHVEARLDYPQLARIFLHELTNGLARETRERIAALRREYLEFLAELLKEGAAAALLAPVPGLHTAAGLLGLMDGVCGYWMDHPGDLSRADVVTLLTHLIMEGLSVRRSMS